MRDVEHAPTRRASRYGALTLEGRDEGALAVDGQPAGARGLHLADACEEPALLLGVGVGGGGGGCPLAASATSLRLVRANPPVLLGMKC